MNDTHPGSRKGILFLMTVAAVPCFLCTGIAGALGGLWLANSVFTTFLVLMGVFLLSVSFSWFVMTFFQVRGKDKHGEDVDE